VVYGGSLLLRSFGTPPLDGGGAMLSHTHAVDVKMPAARMFLPLFSDVQLIVGCVE
jgi:hypothetical protein